MSLRLQLLGDFKQDVTGFENISSILKTTCDAEFINDQTVHKENDAVLISPSCSLNPAAAASIAESGLPVAASPRALMRIKNSRSGQGESLLVPWFFYGYEPCLMYIYKKFRRQDSLLTGIFFSDVESHPEKGVYLRFFSGRGIHFFGISESDRKRGIIWKFDFQDGEYRIYRCAKNEYKLFKKVHSELLYPLPEGSGMLYQLMDICSVLNHENEKLLYSATHCMEYYQREMEQK
jgi:hypothetical protein